MFNLIAVYKILTLLTSPVLAEGGRTGIGGAGDMNTVKFRLTGKTLIQHIANCDPNTEVDGIPLSQITQRFTTVDVRPSKNLQTHGYYFPESHRIEFQPDHFANETDPTVTNVFVLHEVFRSSGVHDDSYQFSIPWVQAFNSRSCIENQNIVKADWEKFSQTAEAAVSAAQKETDLNFIDLDLAADRAVAKTNLKFCLELKAGKGIGSEYVDSQFWETSACSEIFQRLSSLGISEKEILDEAKLNLASDSLGKFRGKLKESIAENRETFEQAMGENPFLPSEEQLRKLMPQTSDPLRTWILIYKVYEATIQNLER